MSTKKDNTTKKPKEKKTPGQNAPVKNTPVVVETKKQSSHLRAGQLFWGGLLIIVGTLLLLNNFDVIDSNLSALWQLWPLVIITAGLSILSLRSAVWRYLSILFVVLSLILIALVGSNQIELKPVDTRTTSAKSINTDTASKADVSIKMGAGSLNVDSSNQSEVVVSQLESSIAELTQTQSTEGKTQIVSVGISGSNKWWFGNQKNTLETTLTQQLPLILNIDTGASKLEANLSEVQLNKLGLQTGASSSVVRLGERTNLQTITVQTGASSVTFFIPKESAAKVQFEGGLSSNDLSGLTDKGNGLYTSENYESATKKIDFTVKSGLSSFEIKRY